MPTFDLEARPELVPQARAMVREILDAWGETALRDDVDLVLTELLGNVVLHAPGATRIAVEPAAEGVRIEVRDSSATRPVRRRAGLAATTGRGLNLVAALCTGWGVRGRDDAQQGKTVWCVVPRTPQEEVIPDVDVDALLAGFEEPDDVRVDVGDAPVALLVAAKDHLDGVLRELTLAAGAGGLPQEVVEPMVRAVRRFGEARAQLRALLVAATARGEARVQLSFRLPVELADSGEQYLQVLNRADAFARDRRMLSLESAVEHRVLREWYVGALVAGLRQAAAGRPQVPGPTFEQRLLSELHTLEQRQRSAQLGALLQNATARLAGAETVTDIAGIAVAEALLGVAAGGAALVRDEAGVSVTVAEVGLDSGLAARYREIPLPSRPAGPSTEALRTGEAVWVQGREDRDARFPHLARMQPAAVAIAALPLLAAGRVVAALRLTWSEPRVFTEDERAFLDGLSVQAAQALARADALQQLRALRDQREGPGGTAAQQTLELMGDAFFALDEQWRFTFLNRQAELLLGRRRERLLGRVAWEAFPGAAGSVFESEYRQAVATGLPRRFEHHFWQDDRRYEVRAHPGPGGLAVYFSDVSDIRKAELERDRAVRRLGLLLEIGALLSAGLDVGETLSGLAGLLVPDLADRVEVELGAAGRVSGGRGLVVPLVARGRVLGTLGLHRTGEAGFTEQDRAFAEEVGRRAGLMVDDAARPGPG